VHAGEEHLEGPGEVGRNLKHLPDRSRPYPCHRHLASYLDRHEACRRYPGIARLYALLRDREETAPLLAETEASADGYAAMMAGRPDGVIA
jgi:hypothetical protein